MQLAIVAMFVIVSCADQPDQRLEQTEQSIFGGNAVSIASVPWVVSIQTRHNTAYCGGAIINKSWILTAQHCVAAVDTTDGTSDIQVLAGVTNLLGYGAGQIRQVDAIARYPNYSGGGSPHNDVALLHLTTPLNLSGPNARAIPLVTAAQAAAGATNVGVTATVSGWGKMSDGSNPDALQAVSLPITANPPLAEELNAGGAGLDSCLGDSGGPLTVNVNGIPRLAGVVSYGGVSCGNGGTYARVSAFESWISDVTSSAANGVLNLSNLVGSAGILVQEGFIVVPPGLRSLSIIMQPDTTESAASDADLYVRRGGWPTTNVYDCRPHIASGGVYGYFGVAESCTWDAPPAGTYYISVKGVTAFYNASIIGTTVGTLDLAAQSSTTALSSYTGSGWAPSNAVDGNTNSTTGALGYSSQVGQYTNHTEWLALTLPSVRKFNGVVLYPRNDSGMVGEGFPIDFKIQVWNGTAWADRVTVVGYAKPGNAPQLFSWSTPDVTDRIRIYATNLRSIGTEYLLQLAEVAAYDLDVPNLAIGSLAAASSSFTGAPGWDVSKLVDGTTDSVAGGMGHSSQTSLVAHTEWVTVQMSSVRTFSGVTLYPRNDSGFVGEGFPIDFKIQVWDGTNWQDRVSVVNYPKPGNSGQVFSWGTRDTTDRIRIYATKLRRVAGDYLLQLAELEVNNAIVVPNLASGGTATASSAYTGSPGWGVPMVVDGIVNSISGSMGYSSQLNQLSNHAEWVTVQLPGIRTFSGVSLHPRSDAGMVGEGFPIDFKVQVWDGTNWQDRVSVFASPKPGNAAQYFRWGVADTTDRIRISATSLRAIGTNYLLQLAEVRVAQ